MYDNEAKPTENQLKAWADATEKNAHREVRQMIANWAAKNATDNRIKGLMLGLGRHIGAAYNRMAKGSDNGDLEVACKFTNVLLAAIEQEYGKDTAAVINRCL